MNILLGGKLKRTHICIFIFILFSLFAFLANLFHSRVLSDSEFLEYFGKSYVFFYNVLFGAVMVSLLVGVGFLKNSQYDVIKPPPVSGSANFDDFVNKFDVKNANIKQLSFVFVYASLYALFGILLGLFISNMCIRAFLL